MTANIAGIGIAGAIEKTGSGQITEEQALSAAQAGTLSLRGGNDSGTITMGSAQHTITTGQVVDVYWVGGSHRGMIVGTVNGTAVPLTSSGVGDNLPVQTTALLVGTQITLDVDLVGDEMLMLAVAPGNQRALVDFRDASHATLFVLDLPAGEPKTWYDGSAETNPIAGDTVAEVVISSGSLTADTLRIGIIKDSVLAPS
jgi:hypothetical protein